MNNTPPAPAPIRAAKRTETGIIADALTDAFLDSPLGDWLIPDLNIRRTVFLDYFTIQVEHGFGYGFIDVAPATTGVAIWLPRLRPVVGEPERYEKRLAAACGQWLPRFEVLDTVFADHHPDIPHHYLALLGVAPAWQRQGIGSTLLARQHRNLDQKGLPAYLEASTPPSRDLYLRHGYTTNGAVLLPQDGPPFWPMWREPQPVPAEAHP